MATSLQVPGTAVTIGDTTKAIGETIAGSHVLKIDDFSKTNDLGIGKSIKSGTFHVGGHDWYMECYPCGVDMKSAGWVSLFLCLSIEKEQVEAICRFTAMDQTGDLEGFHPDDDRRHTYNSDTLWRWGFSNLVKRANLKSVLRDDCLQIRCDVYIVREFPAVPLPDLHRPLSDLLASRMSGDLTFQVGRELFTVHRGLPGPSNHVAHSPTTAGATMPTISADIDNMSGSHVLTVDGYSNAKKVLLPDESLDSEAFRVGGHSWYLELYPRGEKDKDTTDCLTIFLVKSFGPAVKVRFELTLLTLAREVIASMQSCYAFGIGYCYCRCYFPLNMKPEFSPLQDSFHVKCDATVVKEITAMWPLNKHLHFFGHHLVNQVATDVTFDVSGNLFSAHKCVLATRSTAFMAEFFGPAGKGNSTTTVTHVQIDDMEPRVFKALLHFIYNNTLPDVCEDDKVVMAQGLLVVADRYAMERLKLICADMLCSNINDARTAITTLDLADKHGCPKLREACKKFLMDYFTKDAL